MKIKDVMTRDPACCAPDTTLPEVAKMMIEHDCGAVPVVRDPSTKPRTPVGIVTDRDIVTRAVARGNEGDGFTVRNVMTKNPLTADVDDSVDACLQTMKTKQVRRVLVVDGEGACCGIVAQADIATHVQAPEAGHAVETISREA